MKFFLSKQFHISYIVIIILLKYSYQDLPVHCLKHDVKTFSKILDYWKLGYKSEFFTRS